MHAYGEPWSNCVAVQVHRDNVAFLRLSSAYKVRMTVDDAMKLQRQLGVAIREAVGQTELVARTHGDESDRA